MGKKDIKFEIDDSFFLNNGYKKTEATLILRDSSKGLLHFENGGGISLPKEFEDFIPFGNPPSFFAAMGIKNNKVFVSTYVAKNISFNLLLETLLDSEFVHPLMFLKELKNELTNFLEKINDANTGKFSLELSMIMRENKSNFEVINGIDSVLYSMMTKKYVLVVGENDEILDFLMHVIAVIPDAIKKQIGFKINMAPNLADNIFVYGVSPKNIDLFSEFLDNEQISVDLVNLKHKKIYSNYEVRSLEKTIMDSGLNAFSVKEFLENVYHMGVRANDCGSIEEIVKKFGIEFDLAEFVWDVRNSFK